MALYVLGVEICNDRKAGTTRLTKRDSGHANQVVVCVWGGGAVAQHLHQASSHLHIGNMLCPAWLKLASSPGTPCNKVVTASNHVAPRWLACCPGGELFEHIGKRAAFTEAAAADIARSLLQYLAHIHGLGVAHMDIKPENIMFDSQGTDGVLKVWWQRGLALLAVGFCLLLAVGICYAGSVVFEFWR